jgi:hypothetical protein
MLPAGFHLAAMDPLTETLETLDKLAPAAEPVPDRVVEHFLLRTGRPLPRVIVLGVDFAKICRQVNALGGDSLGVGGPKQVAQARADYPGGEFVEGEFRSLPAERNSWDGAWIGSSVECIPRRDVVPALRQLHAALRPGGLLRAVVTPGEADGFRETPHGRVYRTNWGEADLAVALGALDFLLVERDGNALIFRREY